MPLLDQHIIQGVYANGPSVPIINSEGMRVLVTEALLEKKPLSVVRMSDGEEQILRYCKAHDSDSPMLARDGVPRTEDGPWYWGSEGITCGEADKRLWRAATGCTYFAADGWHDDKCQVDFFDKYFPFRLPFALIQFHSQWTPEIKSELFRIAKRVLIINRDVMVAKTIRVSPFNTADEVNFVYLNRWEEAEEAIVHAEKFDCPLVLASPGPVSKYILPEIARSGRVALDIGSCLSDWWAPARGTK